MMGKLYPYLKAIYGAIAAALAATAAAYVQGHGHIGVQADIMIAGAFWTALGVIWGVPNITASSDPGK